MEKFQSLRIVFMGTPEFAVASLDALVTAGCTITGVITAPDKPAGRGMELQQSAIKKYAVQKGLHILQPEKLKHPDFLEQLKKCQADLQVVVAFRMLPEMVWNMPPMGTVNLHGSLLPQYRGAAPINWAIINGETQTGATTFKLKHEVDTGNILLSATIPIAPHTTAGELHDTMKATGADLLVQTVIGLANNTLQGQPQHTVTNAEQLKNAPKIFTETCAINWHKTNAEIFNLIRGLSPHPAAFTFLHDKKLKIYAAEKLHKPYTLPPGQVHTDKKNFLHFTSKDGLIAVKELQLEGKKKMLIEDFLRGYRWPEE